MKERGPPNSSFVRIDSTHPSPQVADKKTFNHGDPVSLLEQTVCVKYVENFRRIRLNGRKNFIGKLKIVLQFSSSIPSYDQNLTMQG
jgi:hypothetical protein